MSIYSNKQNSGNDFDNDGDDYEEDWKLKTTPDAGFTGNLRTVFGNENQWGQSLGVAFEDAEIEDGVLYKHADKDEYKLFAWEEVIGAHPSVYDDAVSADKPDQFMTKTYGSTRVQYEFVGARIAETPEVDDEGNPTGNILCEEDTAGEWQLGNVIMWMDGRTTPKPASKTCAKLLTELGHDAVIEEEEAKDRGVAGYNDDGEFQHIYDWLTNTSNENIARDDLEGRRLRFYKVAKQSDESDHFFHHPNVEDAKTGKPVKVQSGGSDSDDGQEAEDETEDPASGSLDGGSGGGTPEPIQDYLNTVGGMDADDVLARSLLTDMIEEPDNNLTEEMVADYGGQDALVAEVVAPEA